MLAMLSSPYMRRRVNILRDQGVSHQNEDEAAARQLSRLRALDCRYAAATPFRFRFFSPHAPSCCYALCAKAMPASFLALFRESPVHSWRVPGFKNRIHKTKENKFGSSASHRRTWCLRCCLQGMAGILKNSMASGAATDGGPGEQADFVDDKSHQRPEQMPSTAVLWENDDPQRAGLRYGPKAAAHLTIRRCVGSPARRIAGGRVDARPAALPSVWAQ